MNFKILFFILHVIYNKIIFNLSLITQIDLANSKIIHNKRRFNKKYHSNVIDKSHTF